MAQESIWIRFELSGATATAKTQMWNVVAKDGNLVIGRIRWFGRWRKYAFFPANNTVFETTCLNDIAAFLKEKMDERKGGKCATSSGSPVPTVQLPGP